MKRLIKRVKLKRPKAKDESGRSERITNETVSRHRERILAGGRRFKYPIQYAKHKLIINSLIIAVVGLAILALIIWQQLYVAQNTSKFVYRITQLIPVPVAMVDGQAVRYSDYLRRLRPEVYASQNLNQLDMGTRSGDQQLAYYKRNDLTEVERAAYAKKLARKLDITVSDKEIIHVIENQRDAQHVSMEAYVKTAIEQYYGWSLGEYKDEVRNRLFIKKISFAVDDEAKQRIKNIASQLKSQPKDFAKIAQSKSDDDATKANGGRVGNRSTGDASAADGLVSVAKAMKPGQVSDILEIPDGYYIIQLNSKDKESVDFSQIKVSLTKFDDMFKKIKSEHKIKEYIKIPDVKIEG